MPGYFTSPEGDLEQIFVNDYTIIDQYAKTGSLWVWGRNYYGQLGTGNITYQEVTPKQQLAGSTNWRQISCGSAFSTSIKTDGTLWTWGSDNSGELGVGYTVNYLNYPVETISAGTNWKIVNAGWDHAAAIKTDGTLWTWGNNGSGKLGDNTATNRSSPVQTVGGGTNWGQVSAGGYMTAAIKTDGTLWTWGSNQYGQLGTNSTVSQSSPVQTVSQGTNWKLVSTSKYYSCAAIKTDGTLWTWGSNQYGQLGTDSTVSQSSPVQTVSGGTNWRSVASGDYHTAAIKTDGTLWTWGSNGNGRLGDNTTINKSSPVQTVSQGTNWKLVASGGQHTAAIKTDGTLWLWGYNYRSQLGDNTGTSRSSPVQTVSGGTNWKQVSCGRDFTIAIYF